MEYSERDVEKIESGNERFILLKVNTVIAYITLAGEAMMIID